MTSPDQSAAPLGLAPRVGRLLREPGRIGPAVAHRLRARRSTPTVDHGVTTYADSATRFRLLTQSLELGGLGLEVGPSHRPLVPKAKGYDVRVADHLDAAGLRQKYASSPSVDLIEEVDYVVTGNRLTDTIHDQFDYVIASHVIEHTVCLVSFLQDTHDLLRPGGAVALAIPDKRYCFDRFRERSSLGRVIDVYRAAPSVHSEGSVLEYYLTVVHKGDAISWWAGAPGEYELHHTLEQGEAAAEQARSGIYHDLHNWVFTPHHFRLLVEDLHTLGLSPLREKAFHKTIGSEFFITLSADGRGPDVDRDELLRLSAEEVRTTDAVVFAKPAVHGP